MDLPYKSIVSSPPFRFVVGPQKNTFYVHAELVAQSSSSLGVLVNGPMTEANNGCATFEDVDEDTLAQFIEFLYTNEYNVPDPVIIQPASNVRENGQSNGETSGECLSDDQLIDAQADRLARPEEVSLGVSLCGASSRKDKKKVKKSVMEQPNFHDLWEQRQSKKSLALAAFKEMAYVRHIEAWEPRQNTKSTEDFTRIFLCHARLYVFSDQHDIEPLRELSLQKLRLTLSRFQLFEERIPDIVELVRYTYASTMEHDQEIDTLRSLVMDYVVCHLEIVIKDEKFQELLGEAGPLAKDLLLKTLKRLD